MRRTRCSRKCAWARYRHADFTIDQPGGTVACRVFSIQVGAFTGQVIEQLNPLEQSRIHGGRLPCTIALIEVAVSRHQAMGNLEFTLENRAHQGCVAAFVLHTGIGAGLEQMLHRLGLAVVGRQNQRGIAFAVLNIEGVTGFDKGIDHRHIASAGGVEIVILKLDPDIGTVSQAQAADQHQGQGNENTHGAHLNQKPLTLALSQRERGLTACVFKITANQLPLPPGEGWGEGQRLIHQLGSQRLDPAQIAFGYFGYASTVFGISLVKERQDDVLAFVVRCRQRAAEAFNQVLTLFLAV